MDLTGQRFGRLTAEKPAGVNSCRRHMWLCQCDCGKSAKVSIGNLRNGNTSSCGCLHSEVCRKAKTIHGMTGSPEPGVWAKIKDRCLNPERPGYHYYGGRGVKMDRGWAASFSKFYSDMGPRPHKKLTIERLDNDGPYCKNNCVWGTLKDQANNRRSCRWITFQGETLNTRQWEERLGLCKGSIYMRVNVMHWPIEKALTPKTRESGRKKKP